MKRWCEYISAFSFNATIFLSADPKIKSRAETLQIIYVEFIFMLHRMDPRAPCFITHYCLCFVVVEVFLGAFVHIQEFYIHVNGASMVNSINPNLCPPIVAAVPAGGLLHRVFVRRHAVIVGLVVVLALAVVAAADPLQDQLHVV